MTDISEGQAVEIAIAACRTKLIPGDFRVCEERPVGLYLPSSEEPCWYVYVPWGDNLGMVGGSHVIAISKSTGEILFDGSVGE